MAPGASVADVDELKSRISSEWLGRDGVCGVGVEQEGGQPVVVILLTGDDKGVVDRLRAQYADNPVRIRTNEGPIQSF